MRTAFPKIALRVPVGGSPTGAGESPALPIFKHALSGCESHPWNQHGPKRSDGVVEYWCFQHSNTPLLHRSEPWLLSMPPLFVPFPFIHDLECNLGPFGACLSWNLDNDAFMVGSRNVQFGKVARI